MRTYLHSLKSHPQSIQEALITEAPHTRFPTAPNGLEFLTRGIVDLGFENLGLTEKEFKEIMLGFSGTGVILGDHKWPDGHSCLARANGMLSATIEKAGRGKYARLPNNWKEAVLVINPDTNKTIYAGRLVRKDQLLGTQ